MAVEENKDVANMLRGKASVRSRDAEVDDIIGGNSASKKAVPRSTVKLSDWDDFKLLDDTESDRYFVPPHLIPDGFSIEWKRTAVLGQPDTRNLVKIERAGWRPAPAAMFMEILPAGYKGDTVEDGEGMMLYIRPLSITQAAAAREYNAATQKVKDYENATMNRLTGHKDVPNKVMQFERSYEKAVRVPD